MLSILIGQGRENATCTPKPPPAAHALTPPFLQRRSCTSGRSAGLSHRPSLEFLYLRLVADVATPASPNPPVSTARSAVLWLREITMRRAVARRDWSAARTNLRQTRSPNLPSSTRSSNGRPTPGVWGVVRLSAAWGAAAVPPRQAARPGQAPQGGCCPIPKPVPKRRRVSRHEKREPSQQT